MRVASRRVSGLILVFGPNGIPRSARLTPGVPLGSNGSNGFDLVSAKPSQAAPAVFASQRPSGGARASAPKVNTMKELEPSDFGLPSPKKQGPRKLNVPELAKPTVLPPTKAKPDKGPKPDKVATWTPVIVHPHQLTKDKNQFVPANQR